MKPSPFSRLTSALSAGAFGLSLMLSLAPSAAFAEGEVNSMAYQFTGYSDLATSNPQTYSLATYQGKVVMLVVFQHSCGGCQGNAPKFGRLADTLKSGAVNSNFQAIGAEIFNGTYSNIQTYRNLLTNSNTLTLNFPLVHVPHDTAIAAADGVGEKWKRYNSYRDVYFVIDHTGKITARVDGNRGNAMSNTQYNTLRTAINTALAAVPVAIAPAASASEKSFKVMQRGGTLLFDVSTFRAPVTLKILDLQGRKIRTIVSSKTAAILWDGKDAGGKPVPFGAYFVRATDGNLSSVQRITILP